MTENEIRTINGKEIVLYREIETDLYRFSKDAVDMLLQAFEEVEQYRAIGTVEELQSKLEAYRELGTMEELKALKEKSVAKKPDYEGDGYDNMGQIVLDTWICPNCGKYYEVDYDDYEYCPNCGQHIDHSGLTEDD